jgi:hypothetical protein
LNFRFSNSFVPFNQNWESDLNFFRYIFSQFQLTTNLIITEILYNPLAQQSEFIELKNIGNISLHLKGVALWTGVRLDIPDIYLPPGAFLILCENKIQFEQQQRNISCVEYNGKLSSSKDTLNLRAPDNSFFLSIKYTSQTPWPDLSAYNGYSIVLKDTSGASRGTVGSDWRASFRAGGSPGVEDTPLPSPTLTLERPSSPAENGLAIGLGVAGGLLLLILIVLLGVYLYRTKTHPRVRYFYQGKDEEKEQKLPDFHRFS